MSSVMVMQLTPVFNKCGDPMGPVEVATSQTKISQTQNVPVSIHEATTGFGANTAAASGAAGTIDHDFAAENGLINETIITTSDPDEEDLNLGFNTNEGVINTGTELGPIMQGPNGLYRTMKTNGVVGSGTITVENVGYYECGGDCKRSPIMLEDCETGEKFPTAVPIKVGPPKQVQVHGTK
tara:strand:- start:978 stop:1523 length:546 start_codon:yes stop_codon:yes gene_type:complete